MAITVYRCPVAPCGWTHSDKVTPALEGWEEFSSIQHSHTHYSYTQDLKVLLYLDTERVLYSHLATHTPYEWMQELKELAGGKCLGCGETKRECEACGY